jgi:hypothetical protein
MLHITGLLCKQCPMTPTSPTVGSTAVRPDAPFRTDTFRQRRPDIVGESTPQPPFPVYMSGVVEKGFGRGGKELGCPTGATDLLTHGTVF